MAISLLKYRKFKNTTARRIMLVLTVASLLTLLAMGLGLLFKSSIILKEKPFWDLLLGTEWKPLSGKFGFLPFIISSIYVTGISIIIALPISLLMALFLTENARPWVKKGLFPILDILAGIPSVVYGVWGTLIVVPYIADVLGPKFVDYTTGYTVLAGGVVLSIMITPILVSLFIEIFSSVPTDIREAAKALGATRWQTSRMIVLRKSMSGIIASVVLAISRAFGETLAVLMVCGNTIKTSLSLFDGCYPLPALIANNYGEMLSLPMYESALMFAALIMFVIIFIFNAISRIILQQVERRFKI